MTAEEDYQKCLNTDRKIAREEGHEEGHAKGLAEGIAEGQAKIIKDFIASGISKEKNKQITKITLENIEKLISIK